MDVYDRLDLMIRKADSLVPTVRFYLHDKIFAPSFRAIRVRHDGYLRHRLTNVSAVLSLYIIQWTK